jgi:hypothetical protein
MVEKTKRALAILQQRPLRETSGADFTASWLRKLPTDTTEQSEIKKAAGEIMAQTIKATEERVAEVKRRAGKPPDYYFFYQFTAQIAFYKTISLV